MTNEYMLLNKNPSLLRRFEREDGPSGTYPQESIDINEGNEIENNISIEENEPMIPKKEKENQGKKKERVYWVDFLRVLACFLVVQTHCSIKYLNPSPKVGSFNWKVLCVYNAIARPCVPFFIMISGIFFLNPKKVITFKQIFSKYVFRIFKSFLFWSIFYNVIERFVIYYNPKYKFSKDLVVYTVRRVILGGGHALWYLNFVMGLYILTPIFKVITPNREVTWYAVIIFSIATQFIPTLCNILTEIYGLKELPSIISEYFKGLYLELAGNYATYYLLGYLLSTCEFRRKIYRYILYLFSLIGLVGTVVLRFKSSFRTRKNNGRFVEFYSFNVVLATVGLFVFHKYEMNTVIDRLMRVKIFKTFLMSLSECSFGMYLIHMFVLRAYTKLNIHVQTFNPVIWTPIFTAIVFFTCYIVIYLLRKISFFRTVT